MPAWFDLFIKQPVIEFLVEQDHTPLFGSWAHFRTMSQSRVEQVATDPVRFDCTVTAGDAQLTVHADEEFEILDTES